MGSSAGVTISRRRDSLRLVARHLEAVSPLAAFSRGYAIPLSEEGRILRNADAFEPGLAFRLHVQDGVIPCRVEEMAEPGPGQRARQQNSRGAEEAGPAIAPTRASTDEQ